MNNPFGDMLIRIKNAYLARHKELEVPYSSFKEQLAEILKQEGFVESVEVLEDKKVKKTLKINLRYDSRKGSLRGVKQVSKPSLRVYSQSTGLPRLKGHIPGILIISTSQGLMTDKKAKKLRLGGEVLCRVW